MKVWLPVVPSLLQHRMRPVRLALLGQQVVVRVTLPAKQKSWLNLAIKRPIHRKPLTFWQFISSIVQWIFIAGAVVVASLWFAPELSYRVQNSAPTQLSPWFNQSLAQVKGLIGVPTSSPTPEPTDPNASLAQTPTAGQSGQNDLVGNFNEPPITQATVAANPDNRYLPPVNPNLPTGDWFSIPKIGVRSQLQPTASYEEALETGLWQAPDFGKPGSLEMPMIVAGHRYGWKWWWKDEYWKYNSFYLLPQVEVGDRIEIISDQRKWIYEVYAGEEGTEITDYQADLIVYTCKYLQSPLRYFRYARLVRE